MWSMKSAKVLLTVVACMIGVSNCQSQCDWSGKLVQALQQRGGIEEACKMLTLPPAEFDRTHLLFEHQTFQKLHLLQLPSIQTPMQEYANRYLRHAGMTLRKSTGLPLPFGKIHPSTGLPRFARHRLSGMSTGAMSGSDATDDVVLVSPMTLRATARRM